MRVKLFTLRYSSTLGGFDDTPLVEFTRSQDVLTFREHFFRVSDVPHLACVVTYQDPVVAISSSQVTRNFKESRHSDKRPDPTSGLNEADRVLFNTLREWRSERAREEAVPPYVILTNRELLAIIDQRPESPTALSHIDGLGPKKIQRYGPAILSLMNGTRDRSQTPSSANPDPTQEASS